MQTKQISLRLHHTFSLFHQNLQTESCQIGVVGDHHQIRSLYPKAHLQLQQE